MGAGYLSNHYNKVCIKDASGKIQEAEVNATMETNLYHVVPVENREAILKALENVEDAWGKMQNAIEEVTFAITDIPTRAGDPCQLNGLAARNYLFNMVQPLNEAENHSLELFCDIKRAFGKYEGEHFDYPDEFDY